MNKFLKEFKDRGYFYQCTSEADLSNLLDKEKIKAYIGFDCTAESLHVGSLLQIMCLRLLQKNGHQPIVLLGGGTTRIGDPSGKDKTRKILDESEIEKNIKNIQNILKKFLDNDDPKTKPIYVNNFSSETTASLILIAFPLINLLISLFEFSALDKIIKSIILILFSNCFVSILTLGKLEPKEFPENASFAACSEF